MAIPLKQGLKLLSDISGVIQTGAVDMAIPLKQGLKLSLPQIGQCKTLLIWQFH